MNANVTGTLANILEPLGYSNLISPKAERSTVLNDWALDNGRFIVFKNNTPWNFEEWLAMLKWGTHTKTVRNVPFPKTKANWGIVPDVVTDSKATIEEFHKYKEYFQEFNLPMAYAVQNGATPKDVPKEADVVFVGGTNGSNGTPNWKWDTAQMWCQEFPRVHIGGVNSLNGFILAEEYGAESVDGSGMTKNHKQKIDMVNFLTGAYKNNNLFGDESAIHLEVHREAMTFIYRSNKKRYTKRKKKPEKIADPNHKLGGLFS